MDLIRATVGINSTITSRIDRLRPEEQLTLKVASVVGLTVYADLLQVGNGCMCAVKAAGMRMKRVVCTGLGRS